MVDLSDMIQDDLSNKTDINPFQVIYFDFFITFQVSNYFKIIIA